MTENTTTAASGAASLGPLNDRAIVDAIRSAYDLGYEDARKARNLFPEDVDEGNRGREVEQDHGGALIHTLARRLAAPAAQEAEPAEPTPVEGTAAGWKSHAEAMERERDYYRQRVRTLDEHQEGQVWYWQDDGGDHLESMVGSLPVVIRADQLRALLAVAARPQADAGAVPEGWLPMETAPKDGTLVRLLVEFEDHATEDGEEPQPTIGSNTWDNHHEFDEWQFAGWDWCQDRYTQGIGTPIGWLPMLGTAAPLGLDASAAAAGTYAPAAPAKPNCARCQGSGEDPEGFYDQSKGDAGHTHDGPCRDCSGTGEAPAAPTAPAAEREYILPVKTVADLVNNLLTLDQSLPIYAALSIQHDDRRRTITMSPTLSLERVKDGRWIGEGDALNAAVIWSKAEQPADAPAPAAGAAPTDARWWRKRADEIELAVARSGSTTAMRYYTDMRTLMQAVALRAAAHAQKAAPTDAEIEAFREAFDWEGYTDPRVAQRAFGCAVLARWGAAAPAQEAEDGWMPIETAPDGERVLLGPRHAPVVGTVNHPMPWDERQEITVSVVHYNGNRLVAGYRCSEWHRLPGAARARQEGQA